MKIFIKSAALAAALTLTACGGGGSEANQAAAENGAMDNVMAADPAMMNGAGSLDANAMLDANATMDANTQNAMMNDMNTNDPDTNLANGM